MKVTVCFGSTRVIVPCGRGEILVKDLIQQAITRYKKATGKSSFSWVTVHSLQSQSDGGILDPDDRLRDVADDREQIIALYEDGDRNSPQQHCGGDGTSIASSPEIFRNQDDELQNDVEVTNEQMSSAFQSLHVRRGSEPALNQLPLFNCPNHMEKKINNIRPIKSGQSKRWSAAPMTYESKEKLKTNECVNNKNEVQYIEENLSSINNFLAPTFHRDSTNRLSIQFSGESPCGFRWKELSNVTNNRPLSLSLPRNHRRKEPLGQSKTIDSNNLPDSQNIQFIVLKTEGGSLGIHVVPDYNSLGKEFGLLVQGIEPNGRVHCDGRLKMYDRIIEINGRSLLDQPFNAIQEIFRDSLHSPELRLKVIKHKNNINIETPQNTIVNKNQLPLPYDDNITTKNINSPFSIKEDTTLRLSNENINSDMKIDNLSSTNKLSAGPTTSNILMVGNTRKIGKILELELIKGPHGLGFSITTRDNPTRGNCPIYIKNVLPKGAAIKDGRLKTGDRILSVNNIEFTGISQSDAVGILRKIPSGTKVKIIVSRQEDVINRDEKKSSDDINEFVENKSLDVRDESDYNNSIQENKKHLEDTQTFPWKHKDLITFEIPVHDTEKAGLGISVKGKTSSNITNDKNISQDLGIFIKNIINGGAASRDNRLRTNDQLIYINGVSLIGKSNSSAMELLRKTMLNVDSNIPFPGVISLTIARQRNTSPSLYRRLSRDSSISLLTDSSANTETFGCSTNNSYSQNKMEYSETDEKSNNNLMHQRQDVENTKLNQISDSNSPNEILFHNPVLERLTANYYGLRNESYLQATHKTILSKEEKCILNNPITNKSSEEILIIQEDIPKYNLDRNSQHESNQIISKSKDIRTTSTSTDVTYASQLSLDNGNLGFSRDAFGRRSMSEKRHTTLDSRNSNSQANKKLHEKDYNKNQSNELGPSLGMKKSSSLESLQTTVKINKNIHNYDGENYYQQINNFQKSLNSQIDYKTPDKPPIENKKRGSLFKGIANIGSIFKFGKPQRGIDLNSEFNSIHNEQELTKKNISNEQIRIKKQHQKLINEEQAKMQEQNHDIPLDKVKTNYSPTYKTLSNNEKTRIDRIQQLKNEHHKRHMERSENYSSQKNHEFDFNKPNSNSRGSPVGLMDSSRFNHYVNFQEIQHNLNRKQLQYHSQRRNSKESIARPSSNYYEYESLMKSLPYINSVEDNNVSGAMNLVDNNSNSLIRQVDGASINKTANNTTTVHSQQLSKQQSHYPVTENKTSIYDTYNVERGQNGARQKSHRAVNNTNYNRLYQHNNYNYQPIKLQEPLYYTRHH